MIISHEYEHQSVYGHHVTLPDQVIEGVHTLVDVMVSLRTHKLIDQVVSKHSQMG